MKTTLPFNLSIALLLCCSKAARYPLRRRASDIAPTSSNLLLRAAANNTSDCSSPIIGWYELQESMIDAETSNFLAAYTSVPFVYRQCISQSQVDDYLGMNGELTDLLTSTHQQLQAFWHSSDPSSIQTDNILLLGVHGSVFADRTKLIPTLNLMFSYMNASEATAVADDIQGAIETIPGKYENPLLTSEGYAFRGGFSMGPVCLLTNDGVFSYDSILLGDGFLSIAQDIDLHPEISAMLILGHEFGHHMQYEMATSLLEHYAAVPITIVVQLGEFPANTAWMIASSKGFHEVRPAGTYANMPNSLIQETVYIEPDLDCVFTISDSAGNGLGDEGYYQVFFGVTDDDLLISGDGYFGWLVSHPFYTGPFKYGNVRKEMMADAFSAYFLAHPRGAHLDSDSLNHVYVSFYAAGDCFDNENARGTPHQKQCTAKWAANLALNGDPNMILDPRSFRDLYDEDLKQILELDESVCPGVRDGTNSTDTSDSSNNFNAYSKWVFFANIGCVLYCLRENMKREL